MDKRIHRNKRNSKNYWWCWKCRQAFPLTSNFFYRDKSRIRGFENRCKKCRPNRQKNLVYWEGQYRKSAKHRNIKFNLTHSEFISFWQKPCYYCGEINKFIGLDRVDSKQPYEIGNVVPCCTVCNKAKLTQTQKEFIDRCKKIASRF